MSIEQDNYKKERIAGLGDKYVGHSTSKTDWNHCISAEIGNFPEFADDSSAKLAFALLLECKYTIDQMVQILNAKFSDRSNKSRPKRILNIFSNGKCRNMAVYKQNNVLGLKWDRYKFFKKDGSRAENELIEYHHYQTTLLQSVIESMRDTSKARTARLKNANQIPAHKFAVVKVYERNPDVVAEVLDRANGLCEYCGAKAPFNRIKDGTPYLEVHHKKQLSLGGFDSVENAIALCPNCHRQAHYGILEFKKE